jgi:quinol monooxygenase YgiN
MSEEISWMLEVAIHPGKLDAFRAVAADLIAATEKEPNTLSYEWSLSEDQSACHIFERYRNSEAILAHLGTFGPHAERFLAACHPTRFHVYGAPSDAVKAALADLGPVYCTPIGGFNR